MMLLMVSTEQVLTRVVKVLGHVRPISGSGEKESQSAQYPFKGGDQGHHLISFDLLRGVGEN